MKDKEFAIMRPLSMLHRVLTRPKTSGEIIVLTALFITAFANVGFFTAAVQAFEPKPRNWLFLASLFFSFAALLTLLLSAVCHRILIKPLLMLVLTLSAALTYFGQAYGTVFDAQMIANVFETNQAEAADLLSLSAFGWIMLLGVMPALGIWFTPLHFPHWRVETIARLKMAAGAAIIPIVSFMTFSGHYASLLREHREITSKAVPAYALLSTARHVFRKAPESGGPHVVIDPDAKRNVQDAHRELIIMVVGETVRADHWGLNGYNRDTTPNLRKAGVLNFPDFWSCGTSTAISVPCMFSNLGHTKFESDAAAKTDNALDILARAGVSVLWRDNNSSSKGVATRIPYQDFRSPETNPVCQDGECRDEGMLSGLQEWINQQKGDMLIVLHQMGNHGPAYYKRYPKSFERFTPVCATSDLGSCTAEEVTNTYDNAILYTDDFLSKVIGLLKDNSADFETAMFYVSDHGESLGEFGLYLHGTPYALAPEAQRHVPAVMWLGKGIKADIVTSSLADRSQRRWSHDNVFATLLGFFEIQTVSYGADMDILERSKIELGASR